MTENIRINIINKIIKLIPPQSKAVDYLSDILDIGRESAYRRLRGSIPFSVDELIILSKDLGFSIDEFVGLKNDSNQIVIDLKRDQEPMAAFTEKIKKYRKDIDARLKDQNSNAIMAFNYMPIDFCLYSEELFKFSYYTWLHQKYNGSAKLRYGDVIITPELENLRDGLGIDSRKVKNNTFILDSNVFISILKEVSYFHKLKLINEEEIIKIKEDFHSLIDYIEKMLRTGGSDPDMRHYFYLSDFNLEITSSYTICNDNPSSSLNIDLFNRIIISNTEICEAHKEWLESLKKYSTLITESNEIVQAEYLKEQRMYIDKLGDIDNYR